MTVEQQPDTEETVRLVYRPTRDEIAEVIQTRRRVTASGRRQRVLWVIALFVLALGVVLGAVHGAVGGTSVPLLVLAAVLLTLTWFMRRLLVRQVHKAKEGRGEHRVTIGPQGVRVETDLNTTKVPWSHLSGYAETENLFILLHQGLNAINTTPLPKRALPQPNETERLRRLLDRYSARTGSNPQA
jgi:hypothetical protein